MLSTKTEDNNADSVKTQKSDHAYNLTKFINSYIDLYGIELHALITELDKVVAHVVNHTDKVDGDTPESLQPSLVTLLFLKDMVASITVNPSNEPTKKTVS